MSARNLALSALAMAVIGVSTPAAAQEFAPVNITRIADRESITLDPAKAYLLLEARAGTQYTFLLEATPEEEADWARQRAEALAEAIARYPRDRARYVRNLEAYTESRGQLGRRPVAPVEPTEANFAWPDLGSRRQIIIGPVNRFRSEGASLWLYEVPARTFIYYSVGMIGMGDCACMGTVSFPVRTGTVTALTIDAQKVDQAGNPIDETPEGLAGDEQAVRTIQFAGPPGPGAYDPRIPREMIVPAEFAPVERLPNWAGGTINRVMPIPGVMHYEQGRVVDERNVATGSD